MTTKLLIIIGIIFSGGYVIDDAYASIYFDKDSYTWTDKISIRITEHGVDSKNSLVKIYTSDHELNNYKLSKAGNGLYTGEIILTGFSHDVNGDGKLDTNPQTTGGGPNNGFLESTQDDEFTISIKFGDGNVVSKSVKINWNVGDIVFDRLFSASNESIHIQVTDIDMNLNPETLDKIPIHVFSDSDKAGIIVNAIETQKESGSFETIFSLSSDHASSGNRLFALLDDVIYAQYDDYTLPTPYGINDDLAIIAKLTQYPLDQLGDKKIEWSQGNYAVKNGTGTAKIIVFDPNKNTSSNSIDTLQTFVFSDSFRDGITLDLYETQKDTGIFERTFSFSDKRTAPSILYALEGDTVTAHYNPALSLDFESENISMIATMFLGLTGPPLERAPVLSAKIIDLFGNTIDDPAVGEQIQITSDIANGMNRPQKFAYLVMIQDVDGTVVHLAWIDGTLNPKSAFSPSASWIPQKEGDYTATMFVWESVENPTALSPPISLEFTVISEDARNMRNFDKKNYAEQFLFIIPQKEFKLSLNEDLGKLNFYKIDDKTELSKLPRLSLLINMTDDFSDEPITNLALRITDEQLSQYTSFFTQKCIEQRPYVSMDTCTSTEFAFEYDEKWYLVYYDMKSHKSAIEDRYPNLASDYFTRK